MCYSKISFRNLSVNVVLKFMCIACLFCAMANSSSAAMIISFKGDYENKAVYFHWELAPGSTYRLLEIEKSDDSANYNACITFNGLNTKLFAWDKNLSPGNVYYRLKLTQVNGTIEYSTVIKFHINKELMSYHQYNYTSKPEQVDESQPSGLKHKEEVVFSDLKGNTLLWLYDGYYFFHPPASLMAGIQNGNPMIAVLMSDGNVKNRKLYVKK